MNRILLIPAACALDAIAGDPEWFPHPVRLVGSAISQGELLLRPRFRSSKGELLAGALLTAAVVGGTYLLTRTALYKAHRVSRLLGDSVEVLLAWTTLAPRNLYDEAGAVIQALGDGDLSRARLRLARIVGRDTGALDTSEISRAVIETIAESAADGVIAPLFYLTLGGAPLAMAYKAVNTLDSMIGHADARYFYFGKTAARLDDFANLVPARLTALLIIASAVLLPSYSAPVALQTLLRDGSLHKSPNAGQPESAMAGALRVRLGGRNTYDGEVSEAPLIGSDFAPPALKDAQRALKLIGAITLFGAALGVMLYARANVRRASGAFYEA